MKRVVGGVVVVLVLAGGILAVRQLRGANRPPAPGTLVLEVGGRYRTTMTLPALVNWCPVSRTAELEAVAVDTGFAIALRENDAITKGAHPIFTTELSATAPKPNASAAFRWLRMDDTTVVAYRTTGGHVDVSDAGTTLSGSMVLYLRNSVGRPDSMMVTGKFVGLKVVAAAVGCT